MIVLIWTTVLLILVILHLWKSYTRFSKHGVKNPCVVPFLGNMTRVLFAVDSFTADLDKYYYNFPDERYVGKYEFVKPSLVVRDLELVKKITIKDFEHFLDHRVFTEEKADPMFSRNLFALKGQEWKDMRSTLSPAFTSSKIKLMIPFMEEVGEQMIYALKKKIGDAKVPRSVQLLEFHVHFTDSITNLDCKDLTARYASDVIASCAFGLKVDSITNENNKFFVMGKSASGFQLRQILIFLMASVCPSVAKKLKLTVLPTEAQDFFVNLVLNTMKDREARNIFRPDMIHLLLEAKKGRLEDKNKFENTNSGRDAGFAVVEESDVGKKKTDRVWSDIDLVAQETIFLIAGFEAVSLGIAFTMHELALNPDIQDRLYQEIREHDRRNGGKISYTAIQDMTYLDMVVSEVFRKWPAGFALDRMCVKDYNMGKPNVQSTQDYIIRKGEIIWVPTWCFRRDPKYFPNPEKFDPERFSDEDKHLINPLAYIPFGLGPRNCIGSRFALCEIKVFLYQILLHFEVLPSTKLKLPSKLAVGFFNPRLVGGHWVDLKLRT